MRKSQSLRLKRWGRYIAAAFVLLALLGALAVWRGWSIGYQNAIRVPIPSACPGDTCTRSDLAAQHLSAQAAATAVDIGLANLALGLLGSAAIIGTLLATIRSAEASTLAARAAQRSLRQAARQAEQQTRAYVSVTMDPAMPVLDGAAPNTIKLLINNDGTTPAYDVSHAVRGLVVQLNGETQKPVEAEDIVFMSQKIAPGQNIGFHVKLPSETMSQAELLEIKAERSALEVVGLVSYRDIYGTTRYEQFAILYSGDPIQGSYRPLDLIST